MRDAVRPSSPASAWSRDDFPILSRKVNGKPLAYLDNAATSQKPRAVIEAITKYYESYNANVHRSVHSLGEEATAALESARGKAARFIGAPSRSEVVFTRGTTEAINLVATVWSESFLQKGDLILLSGMEHHSNLVPWQLAARRRGARLAFLPVDEKGELDLEAAEENWDPRTRLVAVTHMSNVLGTVNDVAALARLARARGALILVDAAQSAPHLPLDVVALGCDFLALSGHKVFGPMGIGLLWGREALLEALPPYMGGGEMISTVRLEDSTWNELPWKFEAGTPNVEGAVGFAAAIDYLEAADRGALGEREEALSRYALSRLEAVEGLVIHGRAARRGPVFAFSLGKAHPHDIAQYLDREGIAVRAGHHCAQPLHRSLGLTATTRASLAFYNTEEEIDRLVAALEGARDFYR